MIKGLLWTDCLGGLLAGSLVLALSHIIASWHNLPHELIIFTGLVNLLYGGFSLNLAMRRKRPITLIGIRAGANMFWLIVCCSLVVVW